MDAPSFNPITMQFESENKNMDLDRNVLDALPDVAKILAVAEHGKPSLWARYFRINVRNMDGSDEEYFMKVSDGHHGGEALKGEFTATEAIYAIVPGFCPKPIAWGTLRKDPNAHFYLCKFYKFRSVIPSCEDGMLLPDDFYKRLSMLHMSPSLNGRFGFDYITYNGNLPQDNTWFESWEEFFTHGLRHILKLREERAGPSTEIQALLPPLFDTIIPRLLRPLESNGRKLKPSLVHGDLWYGNVGTINDMEVVVYDPASFWAHNEYELGNWRPSRNGFLKKHFDAYHQYIDKSDPKEDYDDRNSLYSLLGFSLFLARTETVINNMDRRFNLQAATLFPHDDRYLKMVVQTIQELKNKFVPIGSTSINHLEVR